jgi:predicted CXXCH cytochrome family protein
MAGGITTLPPGKSNLGTDLSDDHPISFRYDATLAARDLKLKQPAMLPRQVRLDHNAELQCTSCHDAHNDQYGKFLVMDNSQSQLCNSCHNAGRTTIVEHNNCNACHQPHTAPSGPYLLVGRTVSETCVSCHGSSGAPRGNVAAAMNGFSKHDTNPPVTNKTNIPRDVSCNDCHQSHTMRTETASAPNLSPKLGDIGGVNAAGASIPAAQYEYEVCFKCHANPNAVQPYISRQITQNSALVQFARAAVSSHPVEGPGKNTNVPSLKPGLTTASTIYCSSCHGSDIASPGTGASGPHGSNAKPLLIANYSTTDNTTESAQAYALCYSCHERGTILGNQSFTLHSLHIVNNNTPCSVCHDAHGISSGQGTMTNNAHLINFDISVVQPDTVTGQLKYETLGNGQGTCTLTCHGVPHSPKFYGPGSVNVMSAPNAAKGARPSPAHPSMPAPVVRPPRRY